MNRAFEDAAATGKGLKSSLDNVGLGGVDGDNTPPQDRENDSRQGDLVALQPRLDREDEGHRVNVHEADGPVDLDAIIERFRKETKLRFKSDSQTSDQYARVFRRFVCDADLETFTRKQLAGKRGRELLLVHLGKIPLRSRRYVLAALECVWRTGLGLPWPIDRKRDFGKTLPPVRLGRRKTPRDEEVRPWIEAALEEPDPYLRLFALVLVNYGWRPVNQIGRLKRSHVAYEGSKPVAIVAEALDANFKTFSSIVAWLPPEVVSAVEAWLAVSPATSPDSPLLPWRALRGRVDPSRRIDKKSAMASVRVFEERHGLRHIAPVYLRHFVKTACRRAKLSDPATAAWQGHNPPQDPSMRNWYDNPQIEVLLDEQSQVLFRGAAGVILPPEIRVMDESRSAMYALVDAYDRGEIGVMDLARELEKAKRRKSDPTMKQSRLL